LSEFIVGHPVKGPLFIFFNSLHEISPGEELTIDYNSTAEYYNQRLTETRFAVSIFSVCSFFSEFIRVFQSLTLVFLCFSCFSGTVSRFQRSVRRSSLFVFFDPFSFSDVLQHWIHVMFCLHHHLDRIRLIHIDPKRLVILTFFFFFCGRYIIYDIASFKTLFICNNRVFETKIQSK
jgi:hypothetical protein